MTEAPVAPVSVPLSLVPCRACRPAISKSPAWLADQKEAVNQLLGRSPSPQDDLATVNRVVASARLAVSLRPATVIGDPVIAGDRTLLDQVAARPEVRALLPDVPWRIEWVDLTRVLSVQKAVTTDGLDLRVAEATGDPAALVDLCLPQTSRPAPDCPRRPGRPRVRSQFAEPKYPNGCLAMCVCEP